VSLTRIGDELSVAATTRGLSPETKRSCMVKIGFHVQDVAVFVYCLTVIALLCGVTPFSVILEEGP
jgi:energy-coupling factor transporter transmembrane protein EcfT